MSLKEEIKELGFELSQIIKKDIEHIRIKNQSTLELIKEETEKKIKKDLIKIEKSLLQDAKIKLNKIVADKLNEINRDILLEKTRLIDSFIETIIENVSDSIKRDPKKYCIWLNREINNTHSNFNIPAKIYLNSSDLNKIQEYPELFSFRDNITVVENEPIETVCGYKIITNDNSFQFDNTFETKLEQIRDDLSMRLLKFFPIFEVKTESIMAVFENKIKKTEGSE